MHILLFLITVLSSLFLEKNDCKPKRNSFIYSDSDQKENLYSSEIHEINNYKNFDSIINSSDFCFFYLYNGEVVNSENKALLETKKSNIEKLREISFTNPYYKNKRIRFFSINYSSPEMENFRKFYKPEADLEVIFFYKGEVALKKKIDKNSIKNTNDVLDLRNEAFNFYGKTAKRRKSRELKRVISTDLSNVPGGGCCNYSSPTFGFNFGVGTPYWNWPGYYYGFGGPWWGSPYYRPYVGFNASFGGHFGGHHGGCGRR